MDQTTGAPTPPTTDTPPATPSSGDTSTPAEPAAPAGPPPVGETPETPATGQTDVAAAPATGASPAAEGAKDDHPATPGTTPPADAHDGKKSLSKPLLVVVGLLVVGALSAVFLVANMQTGDTQSSANAPTRMPSLPPQAKVPTDVMMPKDPNMTILSPTPNAVVTVAAITVRGKTFPNADVFVGEQELKADAKGMFSTTVTLDEGENSILVTANDDDGNDAEDEIMVTYDPGE
jgi:hypothetical protein